MVNSKAVSFYISQMDNRKYRVMGRDGILGIYIIDSESLILELHLLD